MEFIAFGQTQASISSISNPFPISMLSTKCHVYSTDMSGINFLILLSTRKQINTLSNSSDSTDGFYILLHNNGALRNSLTYLH